jgi:hypothetical protein
MQSLASLALSDDDLDGVMDSLQVGIFAPTGIAGFIKNHINHNLASLMQMAQVLHMYGHLTGLREIWDLVSVATQERDWSRRDM